MIAPNDESEAQWSDKGSASVGTTLIIEFGEWIIHNAHRMGIIIKDNSKIPLAINHLKAAHGSRTTEKDFLLLHYWASRFFSDARFVLKTLIANTTILPDEKFKDLQYALTKGSIIPKGKRQRDYDYLFEFYIYSLLLQGGAISQWLEPDIILNYDSFSVSLAIKRVSSYNTGQISKRYKNAISQINKRNQGGFVVINLDSEVSKILDRQPGDSIRSRTLAFEDQIHPIVQPIEQDERNNKLYGTIIFASHVSPKGEDSVDTDIEHFFEVRSLIGNIDIVQVITGYFEKGLRSYQGILSI